MGSQRDSLLDEARRAYDARAWVDAFGLLSRIDQAAPLAAADLERLAIAAAMAGRDDVMLAVMERLHQQSLDTGRTEEAARAAFWLGLRLVSMGEAGRAAGWLQRAQRLVDSLDSECVVGGYLLLPAIHQKLAQGDFAGAIAGAEAAVRVAERFGDRDLAAFARTLYGRALIRDGRVAEGLTFLDEAMLDASSSDLSPIITGLVYCSVIATCCQVYAMDRAREWTAALSTWCESQPQLAAFEGSCMVHRSEIMQVNGEWPAAIAEARGAARRLDTSTDREAAAAARYQEGEIHRLRGAFSAAEEAYREASRLGREPQPGLALLRLAQGRVSQAAAAIGQAVGARTNPLELARLLPAYVEIMVAAGALEDAAQGCRQLDRIAEHFDTELLCAMAAHARGTLTLARGEARAALSPLREAFSTWHRASAPYIAARIRLQIAEACRQLGDEDGAALEQDAARAVFEELGAAPDLAALEGSGHTEKPDRPHGLTPREIEVLRLLAEGKTNRAIAAELRLSAKTVDRHVGNIFNKLDVSSRAAATACAYRHALL